MDNTNQNELKVPKIKNDASITVEGITFSEAAVLVQTLYDIVAKWSEQEKQDFILLCNEKKPTTNNSQVVYIHIHNLYNKILNSAIAQGQTEESTLNIDLLQK